MSETPSEAGTVQLHVEATDPNRLYLGSAEVVHKLVADFAHAVMGTYDKFLAGKEPPGVVQPKIEALVTEYGGVLMGRDPRYEPAPWQGERQRGKFLGSIDAMKGDDDPGEAFFKHLALQLIKASQAIARGLPDAQSGPALAELLKDARGRLLGVVQ